MLTTLYKVTTLLKVQSPTEYTMLWTPLQQVVNNAKPTKSYINTHKAPSDFKVPKIIVEAGNVIKISLINSTNQLTFIQVSWESLHKQEILYVLLLRGFTSFLVFHEKKLCIEKIEQTIKNSAVTKAFCYTLRVGNYTAKIRLIKTKIIMRNWTFLEKHWALILLYQTNWVSPLSSDLENWEVSMRTWVAIDEKSSSCSELPGVKQVQLTNLVLKRKNFYCYLLSTFPLTNETKKL